MTWRRLALASAIAGACAYACSSFSSTGEETASSDASTEDAPATDASEDAAEHVTDGGAADATLDPCDDPANFCDGFERAPIDLLGVGWKQNTAYGSATIKIDEAVFLSGSHSLRTHHTPEGGSAGGASNYLRFSYDGGAAQALDLSFAMKVGKFPAPSTQLAEIAFTTLGDAGETAVVVSVNSLGELHIHEEYTSGDSGSTGDQSTPIAANKWTHYRLTIDAMKTQASLAVEGKAAPLVVMLAKKHGTPKEVRLGVVYEKLQTTTSDLWIDDVMIRR